VPDIGVRQGPSILPGERKQSFREARLYIFGQIDRASPRIIISGATLTLDRPFSIDDFPMVRWIGGVEGGRSDAKEGGPRREGNS
jgi:hypothetical protein